MHHKTPEEIAALKKSGQILKKVLERVSGAVESGVTTKHLAGLARNYIEEEGGKPVLSGYKGFPDVICISVNYQVVHGIPGPYVLKNGDLVSFDLCVEYGGMITDSAVTVVAGRESSSRVRTLLKATQEALHEGIDQVEPGARVGDIGHSIQRRLLRDNLGIIRDLVGHGVGHSVHEDPEIPNFGMRGTGPALKEGMTIAIEPMTSLGGEKVYTESDNWTVSTLDHSLSAHFEHTVLVTKDGYEILT